MWPLGDQVRTRVGRSLNPRFVVSQAALQRHVSPSSIARNGFQGFLRQRCADRLIEKPRISHHPFQRTRQCVTVGASRFGDTVGNVGIQLDIFGGGHLKNDFFSQRQVGGSMLTGRPDAIPLDAIEILIAAQQDLLTGFEQGLDRVKHERFALLGAHHVAVVLRSLTRR